ncbi:molybdopterin converting factor small subunit [Actinopolyspora biskrensis]|uniref:Molybdopterin converting factor small subunit n=1 Tax=Actinopolyspora biskrensis TaxID=1470178 RepID=A0A852YV40_9ACTN|nr:MoaD/ThiS family protein [Actinopolyspora biskrensis]NYH76705.1 molybdopterin converting factor small subunit [Actinopolyspora biskrensis]
MSVDPHEGNRARVTLRLPRMLHANAGGVGSLRVTLTDGGTLGSLLNELARTRPALERKLRDEAGTLRRHVNFYVDGEECRALRGIDTVLRDGGEVRVVPSVAGG